MVNRRVARLRAASKLPPEKFAELLGVSKQSLTNYEKDKQTPGCHFFIKVGAVFGGEIVAWVLGTGEDEDIERMNVPISLRTLTSWRLSANYVERHSPKDLHKLACFYYWKRFRNTHALPCSVCVLFLFYCRYYRMILRPYIILVQS